jgi:septal ring factor EnvC (AmiA/AmiB activator)
MDAGEGASTEEAGKPPREAMADERPRRPWFLIIASLIFAVIAAWTGVQWKQARDAEGKLRAEMKQVYLEAEQLRAQAAQSQQRVSLLEKQVMALSAEREATTKRLEELEAELSAAKARLGGKKPAPAPTKPAPKR